jgi:hypothetical protein
MKKAEKRELSESMAKPWRIEYAGAFYHVVAHVERRQKRGGESERNIGRARVVKCVDLPLMKSVCHRASFRQSLTKSPLPSASTFGSIL